MTDPRYTDPRYSDPRSDAGLPQGDGVGGPWGWIAGIAAIVLIAFLVIAGVNHGSNPQANSGAPGGPATASRGMAPPSTTGSGGTSPQPMTPSAPSRPSGQ